MNDLPDVASDSGPKRHHRAHQGAWRESLGWPAGPPSGKRSRERYDRLTNYFAEEHSGVTPAEAGVNLVPPSAADYARQRLLQLSRIDGVAEPDRFWRNLLSSQPLAFSIASQLRDHRDAAANVLAALTGLDVVGFARMDDPAAPQYTLDAIEAEWFPPRQHHTNDRFGFDIAALLVLADGTHTLITIEVKYVDSFSPAKLDPVRYADSLAVCGISHTHADELAAAGGSQFLRSILLTDSVRRKGIAGTSSPKVDAAMAIVLGRRDDEDARDVVSRFEELALPVHVAYWDHWTFFEAASREVSTAEWASQISARYVPEAKTRGVSEAHLDSV